MKFHKYDFEFLTWFLEAAGSCCSPKSLLLGGSQCNLDVCPLRCWWLCPPSWISISLCLLAFVSAACLRLCLLWSPFVSHLSLFPFVSFCLLSPFMWWPCPPSWAFVSLCLSVSCAGQFAFVSRAFASSGPHSGEWRLLALELQLQLVRRIYWSVPWPTDQSTNLFH